ncbi:hypothetical protein, partial [Rubinisphaera sp. JC750]|uniref:hypothetical protein n=1 Tax=Rubinisphaera sp. JC750 TaxID=2898658 RepID=UPI001F27B3DA
GGERREIVNRATERQVIPRVDGQCFRACITAHSRIEDHVVASCDHETLLDDNRIVERRIRYANGCSIDDC